MSHITFSSYFFSLFLGGGKVLKLEGRGRGSVINWAKTILLHKGNVRKEKSACIWTLSKKGEGEGVGEVQP